MAFDPLEKGVLLLGDALAAGYGTYRGLNDTWLLQNGTWTELDPARAPPAVDGNAAPYSMTYDVSDRAVLAVGPDIRNDTYEFRAGTWTQLHPTSAPTGRTGFALAFDARDGYAVLFGGSSPRLGCTPHAGSPASVVVCGDTWTFAGGNWTKQSPATSPSPRTSGWLAHDPAIGASVLFGGMAIGGGGWRGLNDTWGFHAGNWTQVISKAPPPAIMPGSAYPEYAGMVYDPDGRFLLLVGENGIPASWAFSNGSWRSMGAGSAIPSGSSFLAVFDPTQRSVLSFAGGAPYGGPIWRYHNGTHCVVWTSSGLLNQSWCSESPPRVLQAYPVYMVYDGTDHYVLLLVPREYHGPFPSIWHYELWAFSGGSWRHLPINPKSGPRASWDSSITFDVRDGYVLLFGGNYGAYARHDLAQTWTYSHGRWTEIPRATGAGRPSPRTGAAMVYDGRLGSVFLYGGLSFNGTIRNDSWSYANGSWGRLSTVASPSPRIDFGFAYDSTNGSVVLFGGLRPTTARTLNDTWIFSGGRWLNVTASAGPAPSRRFLPLMSDMPRWHGAVLFGGTEGQWPGPARPRDTWLFSAGTWHNLTASVVAAPNPTDSSMAWITYDPALGGPVLYELGLARGSDGGVWYLR